MPYSFILALHFIPTFHSVAACCCYSYVLLSSLLISVLQVRLICASLVDSTSLFIRVHGSDGHQLTGNRYLLVKLFVLVMNLCLTDIESSVAFEVSLISFSKLPFNLTRQILSPNGYCRMSDCLF